MGSKTAGRRAFYKQAKGFLRNGQETDCSSICSVGARYPRRVHLLPETAGGGLQKRFHKYSRCGTPEAGYYTEASDAGRRSEPRRPEQPRLQNEVFRGCRSARGILCGVCSLHAHHYRRLFDPAELQ